MSQPKAGLEGRRRRGGGHTGEGGRVFFNLFEVQEIHEFDRTLTIDMYFGLLWIEPRLKINGTAIEKDIEEQIHVYEV